jgi:hypothetical protein
MKRPLSALLLLLLSLVACGPGERAIGTDASVGSGDDASIELDECARQGKPPTMISGTVYAPNGSLQIYGVNVYIPASDPGPLPSGLQCEKCVDELPGGSLARTTSGTSGEFILTGVPSGTNIPLVLQVGRWRRQIVIPEVRACEGNFVDAALTSLPKTRAEGDMPRIAIVTGQYDSLECLVRKLGVADTEFTTDAGDGAVQLYASNGTDQFADGTMFTSAHALWGDAAKLESYDFALFSCEGNMDPSLVTSKTQAEMDNVQSFADAGGRLFLSHYHEIWIDGRIGGGFNAPAPSAEWRSILSCSDAHPLASDSIDAMVDQVSNPKGASFAQWLVQVGASTAQGQVAVNEARQTCDTVDKTKAEQWAYTPGTLRPQVTQFTTPQTSATQDRCGKVVFSEMHVSSGSTSVAGTAAASGTPFPTGCSTTPLSPQERALAFMFFDIASCVGPIF